MVTGGGLRPHKAEHLSAGDPRSRHPGLHRPRACGGQLQQGLQPVPCGRVGRGHRPVLPGHCAHALPGAYLPAALALVLLGRVIAARVSRLDLGWDSPAVLRKPPSHDDTA